MIGNIGEFVLGYGMDGVQPDAIGNRHVSRMQGVYPCAAPDEWVAVSAGSDAEFRALCACIGRSELVADARFGDESIAMARIGRERLRQHLHRDITLELGLVHEVHAAHTAFPQQFALGQA